ncbi:Acyl transferase [Streptomyces iranensis]|uniref:Acyl transferase n=1 Tax=Streptomyces iranensis TaxID=576784 RepID=A0A060ZKA4_9ACTN|nr:Acyl transferase [Streptomyces iranensis]
MLHAGDRAGLPAIGEITFEQPLVLGDSPVDVQVSVEGAQVAVFSRTGEQWTRHATATLADPAGTVEGLDGQWPPAGAQALPVGDVYEVIAARGYEYGPAFRGLQAAWQLGEDLYAEVELPTGDAQDGFGIHPALLDAALHALLAAATDDTGQRVLLPFAWRDVRLHATGASALRVRLSPAGSDAFSLLAADGEGRPVVSAAAIVSRPADTSRLTPAPAAGVGLLALEWAPLSPNPEPGPDQAWVPVGPELELPEAADGPVYASAEPADPTVALALVQAWLEAGYPAGSRLAVRTREAVSAADGDTVAGLASAGIWGLARSAQSEHPDAGLMLLDDDGRPESDAVVATALATGEKELALRDGAVLVPRLRRAASGGDAAPAFDPEAAVLITGGTGTLGGLVARHLVDAYGIRNLVLASRSGPDAPGAGELAAELEAAGGRVRIVAADLSDRAAVDALVADIPDLAGVVHTAGVLEDTPITSLTSESLERVLAAKADAARHLHEATVHLNLRMFVLFSSLSGLLGNAGQGNYAAANTYLDALAARRRALGLAAVSIAWGLWEQRSALTGALTAADQARLARVGGVALPTQQALSLLDRALTVGRPVVAAGLDTSAVRGVIAAGTSIPAVLNDLVRTPRRVAASGAVGGAMARRLAALSEAERELVLLDLVREQAAAVLGYDQAANMPADRAFRDLGFDSVTAVELRNRLAAAAGLALPATLVFDYPTPQALADYLVAQVTGAAPAAVEIAPAAPRLVGEPIAIVSMACRFPGGIASPEDLWRLIEDRADAMGDFPADRGWETEPAGYARVGGFLSGAADFDAEFFGISPREAVAMDPQQRLLLEVSWEALERAGLDPSGLRGSDTGVFAGLAMQDYSWRLPAGDAGGFRMTGNASSVVSGRVAYTFGLEGPAVTVDTACSSSLVAMHLAAQALRNGECSLALAGGVTVMATSAAFAEFALQGGLAADGRVKAFSGTADGTALSEGVGVVVLERLSEARRLGHPVLAVLRGSAVNQDGASNGLSAPNGPSQERVIRRALADARLTPGDVDVVEGHGTGTTLGDPIEAQALLAAYGQDRPDDRPLWLGSVKSNIGHTSAAAGVAGVIKMVEALRHGTLPATLHADEPSPHVDWTTADVRLLTEARSWDSDGRPRRAGVSSFGISGTNAHVILEEASADPVAAPSVLPVVTGGVVPWVLSARSDVALRVLADRLVSVVPAGVDIADVAGSLAASRAGLEFRAVVLGTDREELDRGLAAVESAGVAMRGPVAWVFPGQGSQWTGMGRELAECSPVFAAVFDEVCAVADPLLGCSLRDVMFSAVEVHQTAFTQVAVFAFEAGLAAVARAAGLKPDFVAGHSVGEVTAAFVAGVLTLEDAVRLLVARGALMQALPSGGVMVAVQAGEHEVDLAGVEGRVAVAAVNSSSAVVLSGDREAVEEAIGRLAGRKVRWLEVSHAFHSPLMRPIADELVRVVAGIRFGEPRVPLVSAVTGVVADAVLMRPIADELAQVVAGIRFGEPRVPLVSAVTGGVADAVVLGDPGYWVEQALGTVRFHDVVRFLHARGTAGFLEIGPDRVLSSVVHDGGAQVWAASLVERDDAGARRLLAGLAEAWVHGAGVDWARLVPQGGLVTLPTYPFQHRRYWASGSAMGRGSAGHPLLESAVRLAEDAGWVLSGRVSAATSPWLADHAVSGTVLVPGAALAELVLHAGDRAGLPAIGEITFEQPLVLNGSPVDLQVSVEGGQAAVFSRTDEQWTRHATATLADPSAGTIAGFEGAWPPVGAQPLPIGDAYENLSAHGYAYGPAFRGLQVAWRLGEDVYAEVELPAAAGEEGDGFGIHPALLDAALHAMIVAAEDGQEVRLPFAWRDVRLLATGASALRVRLSRRSDAFSLLAVDGEGQPVVSAAAMVSRRPMPASSPGLVRVRGCCRWNGRR